MTNEEWRRHPNYQFDPLAVIQPALLNSSDIKKYIDKECLIEKKDFDSKRLKPASYEMRFLGSLYDWTTEDERLKLRCRNISGGGKVELPRNSITYLWTKEKLLLPEYIAARFNLHIRHVHKGILLGTGPLVDPGFSGSLLIPLHNLTDNDYELTGEEGIIWVEFTKLSRNDFWLKEEKEGMERPCYLKSFPEVKNLDSPHSYFEKSGVEEKGGVQSAFKVALDRAEKQAKDARRQAEKARRWIRKIGIVAIAIGTIAIAASIVGTLYSGNNLIARVTELAQDSHNKVLDTRIKEQDKKIEKLERRINEIVQKNEKSEDSRSESIAE